MGVIAKILTSLATLGSLAFLLGQLVSGTYTDFFIILAVCFGLLAAVNLPAATVCLVFVLPLFGNRPGSPQAEALLLLLCGFQLGSLYPLARLAFKSCNETIRPTSHGGALWSAATLYVAISVLSIVGVPLSDLLYQLTSSIPSVWDISGWSFLLAEISRSTEERIYYIPLSIYLTLVAWHVGQCIIALVHSKQLAPRRVWSAIQLSLVCSLVVGALDYYGVVDLRVLRPLDPVVNPGDVQFRLQSWFGHSGWFAEFVTLAIPSVMVWLLLKARLSLRLALIISVLVLGEFVLLLTFQRGGWLSYPLTLLFVWAAIYITHRLERGDASVLDALKRTFVKILVTLPVTVLASVVLAWGVSSLVANADREQFDVSRYTDRARDMMRTSDRTDFFKAAFLLGGMQPILGGGSESFAYHFRREFRDPSGRYFKRYDLPLHGSAHNVYFQTFAGKGILGTLALLAVLLILFFGPLRQVLRSSELGPEQRVCLLAGAASAAAFAIYGNVQEIFYIQSLQALFFAVVAVTALLLEQSKAADSSQVGQSRWEVSPQWLYVALGGFVGAHLFWLHLWPGSAVNRPSSQLQYGCSDWEGTGSERFKWCGPRARLFIPRGTDSLLVTLPNQLGPTRSSLEQALLELASKGKSIGSFVVKPGMSIEIPLPLERSELVSLRIGACFIPARDWPGATDSRCLALQVREP